jgi:AcrR family transcriptional regulator
MTTENVEMTKNNDSAKISRQEIISMYMESVLTNERTPRSVFKFCRENKITEGEFYSFFGSMEGLQKEIWNSFYEQTIHLLNTDPSYENFGNREKILTFYYTFFEILTLNRSYILFVLKEHRDVMKNLSQLKGLRTKIKEFSSDLIHLENESKNFKILKRSPMVFSEGAWLQTLFLLKYWMDDDSARFENTDIAIEKSIRAIFDLFDNSPLESVLDFGKFLWKEKMA